MKNGLFTAIHPGCRWAAQNNLRKAQKRRNNKMKYVCDACGWEYDEAVGDPDNGIAPGTKFEDLPDDFVCPLCGVGKDMFSAQ